MQLVRRPRCVGRGKVDKSQVEKNELLELFFLGFVSPAKCLPKGPGRDEGPSRTGNGPAESAPGGLDAAAGRVSASGRAQIAGSAGRRMPADDILIYWPPTRPPPSQPRRNKSPRRPQIAPAPSSLRQRASKLLPAGPTPAGIPQLPAPTFPLSPIELLGPPPPRKVRLGGQTGRL